MVMSEKSSSILSRNGSEREDDDNVCTASSREADNVSKRPLDGASKPSSSKRPKKEDIAFCRDLLAVVEDIPFYVYKVTTNFNPTSSFSRVEINLAPQTTADNACIAVSAKRLFHLDRLEITEENEKTIQFIHNCAQIAWPPYCTETQPMTERFVFGEISRLLLVPLCEPGQVMLEKTYTKYLDTLGSAATGLRSLSIGYGSFNTWHGSPDARVRGTEIVYGNSPEEDYDSDTNSFVGKRTEVEENCDLDSNSSDGNTTTVEAKLKFNIGYLSQLVATCVVSSFIEHKCHPKLPSIVPSVLIDVSKFMVCFYDCKNDVLLISASKQLQSKKRGGLSRSAVLFLWLVINHRKYLQKLPNLSNNRSTIMSRLGNHIDLFQKLSEKNLDWRGERNSMKIVEPGESAALRYLI